LFVCLLGVDKLRRKEDEVDLGGVDKHASFAVLRRVNKLGGFGGKVGSLVNIASLWLYFQLTYSIFLVFYVLLSAHFHYFIPTALNHTTFSCFH
jgi:hypothetical protein